MAIHNVSDRTPTSLMGFSYDYFYFKACYFAGLFRRAIQPILSGV